MTTAPPLGELLDLLRAEGFPIGVDDHVRVGRLLAREVAWTPEDLRVALRALLAKDVRERAVFDGCWTRLFAAVAPQPEEAANAPRVAGGERRPWWRTVPAAIGAAALIAAVIVVIVVARRDPDVTINRDERASVQDERAPATDAGVDRDDQPLPEGDGGVDDEPLPEGDGGVDDEPLPEADPEATASGPGPATDAAPRDAGIAPDAGVAAATTRPPPPPPDRGDGWGGAGVAFGVIALGALAALAAIALASWLARRRGRFVPGPWQYRRAVPAATATVLDRHDVEDGAADLTWRPSEEGGAELDIDRTVARTLAAGGRPVLVYRPPPPAPEYLVLEDVAGGAERWSFLYDELIRGLAREGVRLQRYTFTSSPEVCVTADGRSQVALRDLAEHGDALMVIGDGAAALDPLTGQVAEWVSTLRHVPRRLWVNPLPPSRWSEAARAIGQQTPMEHGAAHALAALHAGVDRTDPEHAYPGVIDHAPGSAAGVAALRDHLGSDGFALLALVGAAGDPSVAAARWLAERFELRLDEAAWLRLLSLPWLDAKRWPPGLRDRLIAAVAADAPDRLVVVDGLVGEVIAASEPAPGSAAHLRWQLDRARVEAGRGDRGAAVTVLDQLATSPLHAEALRDLAGLGVADHRRTALVSIGAAAALLLLAGGALTARLALRDDDAPAIAAATEPDAAVEVATDGDAGVSPAARGMRMVARTPGTAHRGFCGDTAAVLVVAPDGTIARWDPAGGKNASLGVVGADARCSDLWETAWIAGGELRVIGGNGDPLTLYEPQVDAGSKLAFSPDGSLLAATMPSVGGTRLWKIGDRIGSSETLSTPPYEGTPVVREVRFDRSGDYLGIAYDDGHVMIQRVDDHSDMTTFEGAPGAPFVPGPRWIGTLPDGLVIGSGTQAARRLDALAPALAQLGAPISQLELTSLDTVVAVVGGRAVRFLDLERGTVLASIDLDAPQVSPDGRHVVGVVDGAVEVWELELESPVVNAAAPVGGDAGVGPVVDGVGGTTLVGSPAAAANLLAFQNAVARKDVPAMARLFRKLPAGSVERQQAKADYVRLRRAWIAAQEKLDDCDLVDRVAAVFPEMVEKVSKGRVPCVRIGTATRTGDLDKTIIRRYIKRYLTQINYCYEQERRLDPTLAGTVTTHFTIGADGKPFGVTASGLGNTTVEACVADVIARIEFPSAEGGGYVDVDYPFDFVPPEPVVTSGADSCYDEAGCEMAANPPACCAKYKRDAGVPDAQAEPPPQGEPEKGKGHTIYAQVGTVTIDPANGERLASMMKSNTRAELARDPAILTRWPGSSPPNQPDLDDAGLIGFYLDPILTKLNSTTSGKTPEVSCTVKVVLLTYPDGSMISSAQGSASVPSSTAQADINAAEEECVAALIESIVKDQIIKLMKELALKAGLLDK